MNYIDYEAEAFASEETFQNWYFKRVKKDIDFWDHWIAQHPAKRQAITDAIYIMDSLRAAAATSNASDPQRPWEQLNRILENDQDLNHQKLKAPPKSATWTKQMLLWAASLGLLALTTVYFISNRTREIVHTTDFGEITSITLPDNSVVTLNSNSKLTYPNSLGGDSQDRIIRLEGEAYFSVVPTESHQRFLVHTPNNVVVEVLGTEFNVKQRNSGTKIVLNSGKISLKIKDKQQVLMKPGELVSITKQSSHYQKVAINTDLYTSWKCKLFLFEDTPLKEVIALLEDNYGLRVEVKDAALLEQKVSGSVPSDNINLLMEGLSASFGLTIHHSQNRVTITQKLN